MIRSSRFRRGLVFAAYGGPALSGMIFTLAPANYLPAFYVQEKGLSLGTVGLILFAARLWDAVIDPVIGAWSDWPTGRFGRRKLWLVASALPLMIFTTLLFMPWFEVGPGYLLIVVVGWYTAYTAYHIPYLAWGAEIVTGYRERNVLVGLREIAGLGGFFVAAGLVAWAQLDAGGGLGATLAMFTYAVLVVVPVSTVLAAIFVPDAALPRQHAELHGGNLWSAIAVLRSNGPFLRLMTGVFLEMLGIGVFVSVMALFVEQVLGLPGRFNLLMFVILLAAVLLVPCAVGLAGRFGKHRVLVAGQGAYILGFLALCAAPAGSLISVLPGFVLLGAGLATFSVLPASILADTVDYSALRRDEWRPGLHMAASVFLTKLAFAAATGLGLGLLAVSGFTPTGEHSELQLAAFKVVALILPAILLAGAGLVLWNFPIDNRRHAVIRQRLESRARG